MTPKLLINTITSWDEPPRARHQFTFAMAKRIPVAFVARNRTGWLKIKISHPQSNITLIEPIFPIDHRLRYRLPLINELYQIWLYSRIKRKLGNLCVVNFDFTGSQLVKYFPRSIYYCNDEYTSNSNYNSGVVNAYIAHCERKIASRSKFCIATSEYLVNKLIKYNPSTYEIPLGVDASHFQQKELPTSRTSSGKIIVGLLGFISERKISIEIINTINRHDGIQLVLIGPLESSFSKKIEHPERVIMTGALKGKELIAELNKIDVGIALYNLKRINLGVTPNKLWPYMSLGKPTIISKLPNLQNKVFPEKSIYILENDNEVVDLILQAYKEDSETLRQRRIEFAKQNTWDIRVGDFMDIFRMHFPDQVLE